MRPKIVAEYLPQTNEVADEFLKRLKKIRTPNGEVLDLNTEAAKWNLKTTLRNFFEMRMGLFENETNGFFDVRQLIEANDAILHNATRLYYTFPLYKYIRTSEWNGMVEGADYLFGTLQKLLDETIDEIQTLSVTNQLPDDKYCFLRHLLARSSGLPYREWGMLAMDVVFDGINATVLSLNNIVLLDDPKYFVSPEKFLPERWLRDGPAVDGEVGNPYVLLPFGNGPRMCLGRRFAEQELYVMIAKIVQNFRLEWLDSVDMGQLYRSVMVPDRSARIKFTDRH
ncbi:cytochrome P450 10-like [Lingula anatina]|uniref:Cytochrome P450 10-like n=1 Tax=Lingula anatina TaxID=7574 RepID=A0A2R2MKF5_LINAN|nr:cytochrome P450 10-like [Lingula anatina]|eukprot:XP_023930704.1 cytochrome P450 10-like [Lingula anatina]